MDLGAHKRRTRHHITPDSLSTTYQHDLTFYRTPPSSDISLTEFEEIALDRVQLLRILENATLKGHLPFSDDWRASVRDDLSKANLKKFARLLAGGREPDLQARRADHISHFILRLAYCRSEELRRWFLARELEWFRLKFLAQPPDAVRLFLAANRLAYAPISRPQRDALREQLLCSTAALAPALFDGTDFYRVPFAEVCALVRARRVFLSAGHAYVPAGELIVGVQTKFRAFLSEQLAAYGRRFALLDDDRLAGLLAHLHHAHAGGSHCRERASAEAVDPADLDMFARRHYAPCMRHIHGVLRATHHLKHQCRLQYGLFLKAVGLGYEDALAFWREEFTKVMEAGKFDKEHAYNVKHMYGKVGRMVSYAPYSCIKIIMGSVGPGQHHGCPFKHWDGNVIKQKLLEEGMSAEVVNTIRDLANGGHYQVACGKYYEATHTKPASGGINHPNQYFDESLALEKEKAEVKS